MARAIVDADLAGQRYVRFYIVDEAGEATLKHAVTEGYDYIFAYSLTDLGAVEGFSRERKWTQLLTLSAGPDELFAGLNKNNRYKIKRAYRDTDVEILVDDQARDRSYNFYRDIKASDGVLPDIREDFTSVCWINAYRDGLISSTCWFDSGEVLRAKHIVSTRKQQTDETALIGRLTRRLFWEACALGSARGYRYVDLGGLDPDDPGKKGVADFKRSFGGETVPVYVYRHETPRWRELALQIYHRHRMAVV